MSTDWDSYLCRIGERPASIYLDLGIASQLPLAGYRHSCWLRVAMQRPREDGLSSDEEFAELVALEDDFVARLHGDNAIYVGRSTIGGYRIFYFYVAEPGRFEAAARLAAQSHPAYAIEISSHEDGDWSLYSRLLYPSPEAHERIRRRRLENQPPAARG
jgi:hypothetical protein